MVPDAEILCILTEALTALDIPDFTVKINHRKILDGIFGLCGVPTDKARLNLAHRCWALNLTRIVILLGYGTGPLDLFSSG